MLVARGYHLRLLLVVHACAARVSRSSVICCTLFKNMWAAVLALFLLASQISADCDTSQKRLGCRIQGKRCTCDEFSCSSEYRFASYEECNNAIRGKRADICHPNPCLHSGSCIQIAQQPGFRCRCEGTGYYGARCNRACPRPGTSFRDIVFPYECIVI